MIATAEHPSLPSLAILTLMTEEQRHGIEADFLFDEAYKCLTERESFVVSEPHKEMLFTLRMKVLEWLISGKLDIQDINKSAIQWVENHTRFFNHELADRLRYSIEIMALVSECLLRKYSNEIQPEMEPPVNPNRLSYLELLSVMNTMPDNAKKFGLGLLDSSLCLEFIQLGCISVMERKKWLTEKQQNNIAEFLKIQTATYKRCVSMVFGIKELPQLDRDVVEWKEFVDKTYGILTDETAVADRAWNFTPRNNFH